MKILKLLCVKSILIIGVSSVGFIQAMESYEVINEKDSVPFSFLSALKMDYVDFDETRFKELISVGIGEKLKKNYLVAIDSFLEAACYRQISAFKFLAETYKENKQYIEAYKWMVWAHQESIFQGKTFILPPNFIDESFGSALKLFARQKKIDGIKVNKAYEKNLSNWSMNVKKIFEYKGKREFLNQYDFHPCSVEPYLTYEECCEKEYLFKDISDIVSFSNDMADGCHIEESIQRRILAAHIFLNQEENIRYLAGYYWERNDYVKAERYFRKLIGLGCVDACYHLGKILMETKRYEEGMAFLLRAYEKNDSQTKLYLAEIYSGGLGGERDDKRAAELFLELSEGEDEYKTLAIFNLAYCSLQGKGIPKDYVKAMEYYKIALDLGELDALNEIGVMYEQGLGVEVDKEKALSYYEQGVKLNNQLSKISYASYLYSHNDPKCFDYLQEAYLAGVLESNFLLGICYIKGIGVKQNVKMGVELVKQWISQYDNSELMPMTARRLFHLINLYYKMKDDLLLNDIEFNKEIIEIKKILETSYVDENRNERKYHNALFHFYDGEYIEALDLFNQSYLEGMLGAIDMIKEIMHLLNEIDSKNIILEDVMGEQQEGEQNNFDTSDELNKNVENLEEAELREEKIENSVIEPSVDHHTMVLQARLKKEEKVMLAQKKAHEKLLRRIAEISEKQGAKAQQNNGAIEIEFIFSQGPTGVLVAQRFNELLSEKKSKLSEIINDIKHGYKTNKVHPLKGSLKGYFSRKINDSDRLVYRWVGPGQLEIRSCETHYGD